MNQRIAAKTGLQIDQIIARGVKSLVANGVRITVANARVDRFQGIWMVKNRHRVNVRALFLKIDIINGKIIAACRRVLVDELQVGRGGRAAVPDHKKLLPLAGRRRIGERGTDVHAIYAKNLLRGRRADDRTAPITEPVGHIWLHRHGLPPNHRARRGRAVYDHHLAASGSVVGTGREIWMDAVRVVRDRVAAFQPKTDRVIYIGCVEIAVARLKIAIQNRIVLQTIDSECIGLHCRDRDGWVEHRGRAQTRGWCPDKTQRIAYHRAL